MSRCTNCGAEIINGMTTCAHCGTGYGIGPGSMVEEPNWGGLDLNTQKEKFTESEQVLALDVDPNSGKATQSTAGAGSPQSSSHTVDPMGMSGSAMGGVLDDPLGGFEVGGPSLQVDLELRNRELIEKRAKEEEERKALLKREKEEQRIRELGKFGSVPTNLLSTSIYALRVLWRKYKLRMALKDIQIKYDRAEKNLDKMLAAVGETMYNQRDSQLMQPFQDRVQKITDAKINIKNIQEDYKKARVSSVELMKDVMQSIKDTQLKAEPLRAQESRLLEELNQIDGVRKKHEEIIRQADEEHKALIQNMTASPDPNFLASVDQERRKRQARLDVVLGKRDQINHKLDQVRQALQDIKDQVACLHDQRKSFHTQRSQDEQLHQKRNDDVQNEIERAKANLGEIGLANRLKGIADVEITKARNAQATVKSISKQIRLYQKASETYDHDVYVRGLWVLGACLGFILLLSIALSQILPDGGDANLSDSITLQTD